MRKLLYVCAAVCITLGVAQEKEQPGQYEGLRDEVARLRAELDSLKSSSLNSDSREDLDKLEERIEEKIQELENKIDAISRSTAPIILNPRITAFINFAGRADSKNVVDASGASEISDRAFLRTLEGELRAPVDPYAEAVAVLSLEDEAGKGFSVDAEEAYGLIKRLPVFETAPLGMKLKIGKFRAPFGTNNKIHMHDLPWTTRPLVIAEFLGTEHGEFFESGYNPVGIDADFFLPTPIPSTTLEMNLDVVRAGDLALSQGHKSDQPAIIGHLTLSRDWNNEHLFILGASVYSERGASSTQLYGADITYKWAPVERRENHSMVSGGEVFLGKHSYLLVPGTRMSEAPYGWFAYTQYQFSFWTYAGLRYDWLQDATDDQKVTSAVSAYMSYYTTEFLRFRIGVEHKKSDMLPTKLNNVTSLLFDVNFVFGSHPTEPYWVNR